MVARNLSSLLQSSNKLMDFYWKIKWKFIHSARRRGIYIKIHSKVPSVGVTGSVGKTTTCRMVAHILAENGKKVALATTQGTYVGQDVVRRGDSASGKYACRLLLDPRVQASVFEFARGGLISNGMVLSSCDIGAVLNVYDNHIGLDGVQSREDLAQVKKIVIQNAKKLAVLNADDPLCVAMQKYVTAERICFVSMRSDNPIVMEHLLKKGLAVVLDDPDQAPVIKFYDGDKLIGSMLSSKIPATREGMFRPAIYNALFATAIAFGMGVSCDSIWNALANFQSTYASNPGRMNSYEGLPYDVLITWADSPQAMSELAHYANQICVDGNKNIMFCAVGNRPDWYLLDTARFAAGSFHRYICSDWDDLRGRPPGETAQLLALGLLESGVPADCITVAPSHDEALHMAFELSHPGDMLIVVTYSAQKAWQMAEQFRLCVSPMRGDELMERI
jgi:cyanophycin synthetase